jgi:hypothetical protein
MDTDPKAIFDKISGTSIFEPTEMDISSSTVESIK